MNAHLNGRLLEARDLIYVIGGDKSEGKNEVFQIDGISRVNAIKPFQDIQNFGLTYSDEKLNIFGEYLDQKWKIFYDFSKE